MAEKAWQGALVKGFIKFLSWLPLGLARSLAIIFAYLNWWFPNESKRTIKANLKTAFPALNIKQRQFLVKQNLIATSQTFSELGAMWCWHKTKLLPLIKQVSGEEHLQAALAREKGVIFIAPHMGNWELIGPYLSASYPSTFLYRPPNVASIENFMVESRGRFGAELAPTDGRGVRKLMKALKSQQVTVILPDQDPGKTGGVYAPFFDYPARTMTLLSKLKKQTDTSLVAVVMQRLSGLNAGYHLHFLSVPEEVGSQDVHIATEALNRVVEDCVRIAPEQYLWSYKRYRKPPQGYKNIYKANLKE